MRVIHIGTSGHDIVKVLLSVNVGWSHEPVRKRGISHFLEHTLFLGNERHPEPDMETGKYGVAFNGMTLVDRTIFFFTSLPEDAEEILDILLSLVFHPSFPPEKVQEEKESKIISAVVKESDYYPWELAYEWARNLIFDWDFRYSMGTEKELKSMGIEEVREWHRRYYHDGNAILLTTHKIDFDRFAITMGNEIPHRQRKSWAERKIVIEKNIENAEIVFAFPLEKYDLKANLLSILLGNYPTSKFWREFHKEAYMVESRVEWHDIGGIFFYIGANGKDVEGVRRRFEKFIEGLEISQEDLHMAKKILTLEILKMERSGNALRNLLNMDPNLNHDFKGILKRIEEVDVEELKDYAYDVLNLERMRYAAVL